MVSKRKQNEKRLTAALVAKTGGKVNTNKGMGKFVKSFTQNLLGLKVPGYKIRQRVKDKTKQLLNSKNVDTLDHYEITEIATGTVTMENATNKYFSAIMDAWSIKSIAEGKFTSDNWHPYFKSVEIDLRLWVEQDGTFSPIKVHFFHVKTKESATFSNNAGTDLYSVLRAGSDEPIIFEKLFEFNLKPKLFTYDADDETFRAEVSKKFDIAKWVNQSAAKYARELAGGDVNPKDSIAMVYECNDEGVVVNTAGKLRTIYRETPVEIRL